MLDLLSNLRVVLVRPKFPENIGAAARAIANMGLGRLHLVAPERLWDEPMRRLASRGGAPVLDAAVVHDSLQAALADCAGAVAFTARKGRCRGELITCAQAAERALALAAAGEVALVFGPEDRGLTTAELDACTMSAYIPTAEQSSLNLAQAVVVAAYQARAAAERAPALNPPGRSVPMDQMAHLHGRLKEALTLAGVLRADNPDHFYRPFKAVLDRARPDAAEVRAWHGVARQMMWLAGRDREPDGD